MKDSATQNKNTTSAERETLEIEDDMETLSQNISDLMEQIEKLTIDMPPTPEVYRWMATGAEERLLTKLKKVSKKLEFYTLTPEERNAADVLASTGEVKVCRNSAGNLELQYNEPNVFEKLISNTIFSNKSV